MINFRVFIRKMKKKLQKNLVNSKNSRIFATCLRDKHSELFDILSNESYKQTAKSLRWIRAKINRLFNF